MTQLLLRSYLKFSDKDDFDFHAVSIVKLLGIQKSLNVTQNIMRAEIKTLVNALVVYDGKQGINENIGDIFQNVIKY